MDFDVYVNQLIYLKPRARFFQILFVSQKVQTFSDKLAKALHVGRRIGVLQKAEQRKF